jgi:hypothetical protein
MPTVQGTDDFDHAIDGTYYADGFFGAPTAVTSPLYASQAKSLQIVSDGGNVGARHNITGTPTFGWAGFAFNADTLPGASDVEIATFGTAAGVVPAVVLSSVGIYATIGGDIGVEFALSTDTWYWIECIADVSGATQRMHFRVEGVDGDPAEIAGGASTISWHQHISFAGNPAGFTSWRSLWKWGSATSASDWLGEPSAAEKQTFYASRRRMVAR